MSWAATVEGVASESRTTKGPSRDAQAPPGRLGIRGRSRGKLHRARSTASAAGPDAFTLHLTCDNGKSFDITVNDEHSVAAHVVGSNSIAVLENGNGTTVPAFDDGGPPEGTLVSCDTGIPGFTALVLFTPAHGH